MDSYIAYLFPVEKNIKKFLRNPQHLMKFYNIRIKFYQVILWLIFQGDLWKKMASKYLNQTVMSLILYFDDFKTWKPLGSYASIHSAFKKFGDWFFSGHIDYHMCYLLVYTGFSYYNVFWVCHIFFVTIESTVQSLPLNQQFKICVR